MKALFTALALAQALSTQAEKIRIAAAANMRYAMEEIISSYQNLHPGQDIEVVYGSSGNIFAQIQHGAPFDLFFSADEFYPQKLAESGLAVGPVRIYARGRLVLWSSSIDVGQGIEVLNQYPKAKIAIATPRLSPYGEKTLEVLQHHEAYEQVRAQLIFGENLAQTAQFGRSGNAQFCLISLSLALSPPMVNKGNYYLVDEKSHHPLEHAFIQLRHSKDKALAYAFAQYFSSPEAAEILSKNGFVPASL